LGHTSTRRDNRSCIRSFCSLRTSINIGTNRARAGLFPAIFFIFLVLLSSCSTRTLYISDSDLWTKEGDNVTLTNSSNNVVMGSLTKTEDATTIILDGGGKDICIGNC